MFKIIEDKIASKMSETNNKKKKYQSEKSDLTKKLAQVSNLLENYSEIKQTRKVELFASLVDLGSVLLIPVLPELGLPLTIFFTVSILGCKTVIDDNKQQISLSDYTGRKDEQSLLDHSDILTSKFEYLTSVINATNESYRKYDDLVTRIQLLKKNISNTNSQFDYTYEELLDFVSQYPILAFDSEEEYKNYESFDKDTQKQILSSKILFKKKDN